MEAAGIAATAQDGLRNRRLRMGNTPRYPLSRITHTLTFRHLRPT